MVWYYKYLEVFEHPFDSVSFETKMEIVEKLRKFSSHDSPLCSVVLIAHNEEEHILGCLWSLCENFCDFPVEIIVVNNNSTDHTSQILKELGVKWYDEKKKGPGFARQCGLEHAKGKYYICIDSDTLYPPYYIATHVSHLQKEGVVCTYGLWSFLPDQNHSKLALFFYEFFRDVYLSIQNINRPELCVRGMVLAFHTESGKKVGFRTNILRGEDGMMALGLKQYGKLVFLRTVKVRAITSNGTLNGGGSLLKNTWFRFIKGLRNLRLLFTTQEEYEDKDYNLIKKKDG